ncbi:MAG: FAD-dependent monooxygenase [Parachlamydia sp.]|nr:FAD-dependent monooxygenase [Parachlamydia sp.]
MKYKLSAKTLVVGGGPAGLATAIEAITWGDVLVLERRSEYTRQQSLFLTGDSLALLEKRGVELPELSTAQVGPEERVGFIAIAHLEKQLAARAKALGVTIAQGKFMDMGDGVVIAEMDGRAVSISYAILAGADGSHSHVREKLGIGVIAEGKAIGISALIPFADPSRETDTSPPMQTQWGFARRIATPAVSIVFLQSKNRLSQQEMVQAVAECGWQEEARLLEKQHVSMIDGNIEVLLQQAERFADSKKGAILVGDAAATASFFEGMGANTALKTAAIAGCHLELLMQGESNPFEREMREATNALLEDSRYLFHCGLNT